MPPIVRRRPGKPRAPGSGKPGAGTPAPSAGAPTARAARPERATRADAWRKAAGHHAPTGASRAMDADVGAQSTSPPAGARAAAVASADAGSDTPRDSAASHDVEAAHTNAAADHAAPYGTQTSLAPASPPATATAPRHDTEAPRRRRSLSNLGGAVELEGAPREAELLARALQVDGAPAPRPDRAARTPADDLARDDADRAHVHGFHSYPARMHPETARRLVESFAAPGSVVLDPFCGSGTVLVEALLAGRQAVGTDLNPLAVELAWLKVRPRDDDELDALVDAARAIAKLADERRKARAGASRRYPEEDAAAFEPHVLLELDSIRTGALGHRDPELRRDLALVLSAILVKLSRRRGDTSEEDAPARRIGAGYPAKLYVRKAEELAARLRSYRAALPRPAPRARVAVDDATDLRGLGDLRADAVVSSPPYAATYDYLAHHAMRLRWLGWDADALAARELGARRRYANIGADDAARAWRDELGRFLEALAGATRKGAPVVLVLADSAVRGVALRADQAVAHVARAGGLFEPVARASQARPHFHGPTARAFEQEARREHALLLVRR